MSVCEVKFLDEDLPLPPSPYSLGGQPLGMV
uniref:Uncharacterized protein n=1 Tax=Anopheles minimus TaxID=112268 RepID=A0A182WNC9_9DIPT